MESISSSPLLKVNLQTTVYTILCSSIKTLEFRESTTVDNKKSCYYYKAEFSENPKTFGGETKFKTTHISTIDGKSSKPIITETVYKGLMWPILDEVGMTKGFPLRCTFKTVIRD